MRPVIIVSLLITLELFRRLAMTATCYVHVRYHPELLDEDHAVVWRECVDRHLLFLFRLYGRTVQKS